MSPPPPQTCSLQGNDLLIAPLPQVRGCRYSLAHQRWGLHCRLHRFILGSASEDHTYYHQLGLGSLETEPEMKILEKVAPWEEGVRGEFLGPGIELSKDVASGSRTAGFGRLPAQHQNSPGNLGLLVWAGALVRLFQRNRNNRLCIHLCTEIYYK